VAGDAGRVVVGDALGMAGADGLGGALVGGAEGVGLMLGNVVALAEGVAADAVDVAADGFPGCDSSGTLSRMFSGSAPSRCGGSYENSPEANATAAPTVTTAPAATSTARRRRRDAPFGETACRRCLWSDAGACRPGVSSGTAASGTVSSGAASRGAGAGGASVPDMVTGRST